MLLAMPAWSPGLGVGAKLVTVYPQNQRLGLPSIHGVYVLMHAATGRPEAVLDAGELTARRTAAASALITGNPDLTAIYAVSGPEGEGAAAAVEEAGKSGQIKVYSYDATPAQVEALRAGTITALLAQPSALIGAEAVKAAVAYVSAHPNREPVPAGTDVNELALKVLDKDNVDKPESADYIYAATCKA